MVRRLRTQGFTRYGLDRYSFIISLLIKWVLSYSLDWMIDKKSCPWFIPSVNRFMSKIPEEDWYLTPGHTNLNESAHPLTNMHTGTGLPISDAIKEWVQVFYLMHITNTVLPWNLEHVYWTGALWRNCVTSRLIVFYLTVITLSLNETVQTEIARNHAPVPEQKERKQSTSSRVFARISKNLLKSAKKRPKGRKNFKSNRRLFKKPTVSSAALKNRMHEENHGFHILAISRTQTKARVYLRLKVLNNHYPRWQVWRSRSLSNPRYLNIHQAKVQEQLQPTVLSQLICPWIWQILTSEMTSQIHSQYRQVQNLRPPSFLPTHLLHIITLPRRHTVPAKITTTFTQPGIIHSHIGSTHSPCIHTIFLQRTLHLLVPHTPLNRVHPNPPSSLDMCVIVDYLSSGQFTVYSSLSVYLDSKFLAWRELTLVAAPR